jgi:hypothetical protein
LYGPKEGKEDELTKYHERDAGVKILICGLCFACELGIVGQDDVPVHAKQCPARKDVAKDYFRVNFGLYVI